MWSGSKYVWKTTISEKVYVEPQTTGGILDIRGTHEAGMTFVIIPFESNAALVLIQSYVTSMSFPL